eukprot:8775884-Pyramimonas_sp.AAC.1
MQDLWARFHAVMRNRGGSLNVLWTNGHATGAQRRIMLLSDTGLYLNRAAGRFAETAASRAQVSDDDVRRAMGADRLASDVLYRLLAVQREVLFCGERERAARAPRRVRGQSTSFAKRMRRLRDAGHQPEKKWKAVIRCPACATGFTLRGSLRDFWPDPRKPRCLLLQRVQSLPARPASGRDDPEP